MEVWPGGPYPLGASYDWARHECRPVLGGRRAPLQPDPRGRGGHVAGRGLRVVMERRARGAAPARSSCCGMPDARVLSSTYRLQLQPASASPTRRRSCPTSSELGVSHLYLSPILQATPGSMHGYDVVDHTRVSDDLGGRAGLAALAETAHARGLGIVVDVVPNHMAMPEPEHLNGRSGRCCARARRRRARTGSTSTGRPAAAASACRCSARRSRRCSRPASCDRRARRRAGAPVRRHGFPVAPGTEADDVADGARAAALRARLVARQGRVLNYRRFFDVDTLIAIRVELDDVFDATHARAARPPPRRASIDGFRIDHPDGLADPQGYLERLRDAHRRRLGRRSRRSSRPARSCPPAWPCAGTTGYDAMRAIQAALVPRVGAGARRALARRPAASRRSSASRSRPRASSCATCSSPRCGGSRARRAARRPASSSPTRLARGAAGAARARGGLPRLRAARPAGRRAELARLARMATLAARSSRPDLGRRSTLLSAARRH